MNVLIAGGGTGGHLFPAIAVAKELRRRHPASRIVFVGTERGLETRLVPQAGFELQLLPVAGLRRLPLRQQLCVMQRLPKALWQAVCLVKKLRPQVAVSVGGYAAGPAMLAAWLCKVPCVVLEANTVPGMTNRILAKLAKKVIAGMPCGDFGGNKTQVLGNPVRPELLAVRDEPYAIKQPLHVLVLGGSQGAKILNDTMLQLMHDLGSQPLPLVITHQTGVRDAARVKHAYDNQTAVQAHATAFIDDMVQAYRQADLVVCRAGASTLAELGVCGRPALLVPFARAADDHQTVNAQIMVAAGAADLLPEAQLSAARLFDYLQDIIAGKERLLTMAARAHAMGKPHALQDIASAIEQESLHV